MLTTTSLSAQIDEDYIPITDYMVTIPAGETMVDVQIDIVNDKIRETSEEQFTLRLSANVDGDVGILRRARVIIIDDDGKYLCQRVVRS